MGISVKSVPFTNFAPGPSITRVVWRGLELPIPSDGGDNGHAGVDRLWDGFIACRSRCGVGNHGFVGEAAHGEGADADCAGPLG